jgi:glucose dehydrogenase
MKTSGLIYEDSARYDTWTKLLMGAVVAIEVVIGVSLIFVDLEGALVMFAAAVLVAVIFWAILPRGFQVYEDRVRIGLGGPLSWSIPLRDIQRVGPAPASSGFIYHGVRFVTSGRSIVEIRRRRGMDVVFSPSHPDEFIEQVERARDLLPK